LTVNFTNSARLPAKLIKDCVGVSDTPLLIVYEFKVVFFYYTKKQRQVQTKKPPNNIIVSWRRKKKQEISLS